MLSFLLPIGFCVTGLFTLLVCSVVESFHRRLDYPGMTREEIRDRMQYEESVRVQEAWADSHRD